MSSYTDYSIEFSETIEKRKSPHTKNVGSHFWLLCIYTFISLIDSPNVQKKNSNQEIDEMFFFCLIFVVWCAKKKAIHRAREKKITQRKCCFVSLLSVFFLFFCGNLCYCYTQHVYVVLLHCFKRTQWLACLCVATIFNVYTLSTNPFYSLSISFAVSDFLISICRYIYVRSDEGKKKNCTMYRVWRLFVCVYCVWTMCIRFFHANVCVSVLFSVSSFILSLNSAHWSHTIL